MKMMCTLLKKDFDVINFLSKHCEINQGRTVVEFQKVAE